MDPMTAMAVANMGLDIGKMYYNSLTTDYSQELKPFDINQTSDLSQIRGQEYQNTPIDWGKAVMGGTGGLQAAIISKARQSRAEDEFNVNKQKQLRDAISRNTSIGYRDMYRSNLGQSSLSQVDKFLSQVQ